MTTETITITPKRSLGPITAQVTLEEQHSDELTITSHPVEKGAAISDHAFKNPARVVVRVGWSNSSAAAGGDEGYVRAVYERLLKLQASRIPFDVVTGKRLYKNMLFASLGTTTDARSEASLIVTATLQEVIIAQTQVTSVPPGGVHAEPEKTAPTENMGTVQPRAATLAPGG